MTLISKLSLCISLLSSSYLHLASGAPGYGDGAPTVTIGSGPLVGTTTKLTSGTAIVNQFLGVPFAQSPPERFSPPKVPKKWTKPLLVQSKKPACIQKFYLQSPITELSKKIYDRAPKESEDCLYLNVFTPSKPAPKDGRAVLVFLFGGAFQWGDASHPWYDGSSMAGNQDVVVVVPNYRTNVFGFSGSPQLPLTSRNAGLLDQRRALAWVQENIARFGGDRSKVTLWGWSAGASAVDKAITSWPNNPPFRAAIMDEGQSTYPPSGAPPVSPTPWELFTKALGCKEGSDTLKCARNADIKKIREVFETTPYSFLPLNDGVTQVADPAKARAERRIANVPALFGGNTDEGSIGAYYATNVTAFLSLFLPPTSTSFKQILAAYPIGKGGLDTDRKVAQQISTDIFQCAVSLWGRRSIEVGYKVWRYSLEGFFPNTQVFPGLGSYHGTQIPLIFGTYETKGVTPDQIRLSKYMQKAWADFAKDPSKGPGWNRLGTSKKDLGLLGAKSNKVGVTEVPEEPTDAKCDLYKSILNPVAATPA